MDVIMKGHYLNSLVEARSPYKAHFLSSFPFVPYSTCPNIRTLLRNTSPESYVYWTVHRLDS